MPARRSVRTSTAVLILLAVTACSALGVTTYVWASAAEASTANGTEAVNLYVEEVRGGTARVGVVAASHGVLWRDVRLMVDDAPLGYDVEVTSATFQARSAAGAWDGARLARDGAVVMPGDTIFIRVNGAPRDVVVLVMDIDSQRAMGALIVRGFSGE